MGVSTELVVEMGRRAKVPMTFAIMPWPQAYDQTQMKVETCLFSTARLENRERIFKWVGPLATNEWGLYAKTGFKDPIAKLADARPYRIGGVTNDAKVLWLRDNALTNIVTVNEDKLVGHADPRRKKLDAVDLWVTASTRKNSSREKQRQRREAGVEDPRRAAVARLPSEPLKLPSRRCRTRSLPGIRRAYKKTRVYDKKFAL